MDDLLKLAERCEAATAPDRELDFDIWRARYPRDYQTTASRIRAILPRGATVDEVEARLRQGNAKSYTASIDAAMGLVPIGATWEIGRTEYLLSVSKARAFVGRSSAVSATPALALCAAALRVRSSVTVRGE